MTDEYLQVTIKVLRHHHKSNLSDGPLRRPATPAHPQTHTHPPTEFTQVPPSIQLELGAVTSRLKA